MPLHHAVLWIDHHTAQLLHFDAIQVRRQRIKAQVHPTRQHGSEARSGHAFFGEVCDSLHGTAQVLVMRSHTAQADLQHYIEKHRAELALRIAGWETVQRMSARELVAVARHYFTLHAGMATPMKAR